MAKTKEKPHESPLVLNKHEIAGGFFEQLNSQYRARVCESRGFWREH
jgi:hypothetical protein